MRHNGPSGSSHEGEAPHGIVVARLVSRAGNSETTLVLTFATDARRFSVIVRERHGWRPVMSGPAFDTVPIGGLYILVIRHTAGSEPVLEHARSWRSVLADTRAAGELVAASAYVDAP